MTTPIPEAAIEPALRAWFEHERTAHPMSTLGDRMRAALTAARPLIEAEIRKQVAVEIRAVAQDPDRRRPLHTGAEHATDLTNDFEWCAQIAATIAEGPNDEPA